MTVSSAILLLIFFTYELEEVFGEHTFIGLL